MAQSPMPATATADHIVFELDRFERADGDRLELTGRWYGIRGRRFVRPTLTLLSGQDRMRTLAELEHKPWAAEEGAEWHAAFSCDAEDFQDILLAVAPDIAVHLPAPGSNGGSPRRLEATSATESQPASRRGQGKQPTPSPFQPRRRRGTPAPEAAASTPASKATPKRRRSEPAPELEEARRPASDLRLQVERLEDELRRTVAERDEVKAAFERRNAVVGELRQALDELKQSQDQATRRAQQGEAALAEREARLNQRQVELEERELKLAERDTGLGQLESEQNAALTARGRQLGELAADLEQRSRAISQREAELDQQAGALAERERALAARAAPVRGPELRTAARAEDPTAPRPGWMVWLPRAFVLVCLIVPIVALLVLTKAL